MPTLLPIFDSHLHIIDRRFPLVANQGYLPEEFTVNDYRQRMQAYNVCGGAVVSGSFQVFDQAYLLDALAKLGPGFVGVTQLPTSVTDEKLLQLDRAGVRAVRFNLKRGGSEDIKRLASMAARLHEVVGWHVELYANASELEPLYSTLISLPAVVIDHLGLSREGLPLLTRLAERGVRVKATGFGRVNFSVPKALISLYNTNPACLMFGTDLPSTRAPRPYEDRDITDLIGCLGQEAAEQVLFGNAVEFYRLTS